jgi:AcrR family transcriptional regulator
MSRSALRKARRSPRQRRSAEAARQLILEAAARQFRAGGPEAIRLQEIAARVGIAHPTILHHFGSREGLIEALVVHALQGFQAEILAGWPSESVPDVEGVLARFYRMAEESGTARLLAWLILSGRELGGFRAGILRPLAERVQAGRTRARRRAGLPPPDFGDTLFASVLLAVTVFGDVLFGALIRRGLGLPDDAVTTRQFRAWIERLLSALAVPAPAGSKRSRR